MNPLEIVAALVSLWLALSGPGDTPVTVTPPAPAACVAEADDSRPDVPLCAPASR